jgi:hypothetical protein
MIDLPKDVDTYINAKKVMIHKKSKEETVLSLLKEKMYSDKLFTNYISKYKSRNMEVRKDE